MTGKVYLICLALLLITAFGNQPAVAINKQLKLKKNPATLIETFKPVKIRTAQIKGTFLVFKPVVIKTGTIKGTFTVFEKIVIRTGKITGTFEVFEPVVIKTKRITGTFKTIFSLGKELKLK